MSNQKGFTLVELAIVLMIIGLLIGGVLRGQELIENARITATAKQITSYSGAIATFRDIYGTIPGDLSNATRRLSGCNSASSCVDGNSDGVIGVLNAGQGVYANEPWQSVPNDINSENTQFWKHLALAKIISGVDPTASRPEWALSHPTAPISGGFFARYTNFNVAGYSPWTGTVLVLRGPISGDWLCGGGTSTGMCAITPQRAALLDRKMDDGRAISGDVRAVSANWSNGCGNASAGTQDITGYDERNETKACDMMFKI